MNRVIAWLLGVAILVAAACGPSRQPPPAGPLRPDSGGVAGYQHGLERSRFDVGSSRRNVDEHGYLKIVGASGTFAVDAVNGSAAGVPNASRLAVAEAAQAGPPDPDAHNQQVMDYFVSAGIPKEQVLGVDALTLLAASGETAAERAPQPVIVGYQSALKRQVDGVLVADSVAWARFTDRNELLSENLYWPALSAAVVADARRFRERLNDPANRQTFLASLPAGLPSGEVVIHHSAATNHDAFQAVATYDVVAPGYAPTQNPAETGNVPASWVVRHFNSEGREIRLPQEQYRPGSDDRRPSRSQ